MIQRIRSAAFSVFLFLFVVSMGALCAPAMLLGRDATRAVAKLWSRLALQGLALLAGVRYRVEGAEHIPSGGALIAANHQSMWETIALYLLAPKPVMIFKKELARIPIYGWWAHAAGNIAIDRKGGAKALRAMARDAKAHVEAGEQIIIFPEGTRVKPGETANLLSGVAGVYAAANAPCVPAVHDSGKHWRHPGYEKIPGTITLRFLPAIAPNLDRKVFLRELKARFDSERPDLAPVNEVERVA